MDLDYWWLLLIPVVFGLGWMAARFDVKHLLSESANLPRSYFRGLNFLLNEQPDQAIDAFIEVVKLDPETTELHFALGSLFRRRGETERAIRVHQNLLNRSDLPSVEREHAMFELGLDFLKAGLLDRAEDTFKSLDEGAFAIDAQRCLLTIYEIEKDWAKAIETAEALEKISAQSFRKEVAQFHCERAQEALQKQDSAQSVAELRLAREANPANVRATILAGDAEMATANPAGAIDHWRKVETQSAAHLPLIVERLMKAYSALGRDAEGAHLLMQYLDKYPSNDLLDTSYTYIAQQIGTEAAHQLVRGQMQKAPNLAGMSRLLEAQVATAEEPRRGELELMRNLMRQRTKNLPRYTCQSCGFRARLFYWQCPGCSGWETYAPRRVEPMASGG
ncbi:lipopolysaccharide assembly protein LapB [Pararobbsia alpina]|uniref:Lipopolysaccharide assembly protein B n=1 Tax=Pararobbsia alpina TaxID=621374 RepID=A0A6S7AY66_9BURK|nr:lipopolysaccharide assembly protein LapB [Pararobbsia alpina]CAB3781475.1 Lipopolysaccharide assembly protein B [Pararobbsia alpina]